MENLHELIRFVALRISHPPPSSSFHLVSINILKSIERENENIFIALFLFILWMCARHSMLIWLLHNCASGKIHEIFIKIWKDDCGEMFQLFSLLVDFGHDWIIHIWFYQLRSLNDQQISSETAHMLRHFLISHLCILIKPYPQELLSLYTSSSHNQITNIIANKNATKFSRF